MNPIEMAQLKFGDKKGAGKELISQQKNMRKAQLFDPGGEYMGEQSAGQYIEPDQPPMPSAQPQIPPVPPGVVPGTDDYFAWVDSLGIAKSPADFQQIMKYHQSTMQPQQMPQGQGGGVMDMMIKR